MQHFKLKSLLFGVLFAAGCQAFVDPNPNEIGQGGALANACKEVECKPGTHCALTEVQCIKAPCDPVPQCVADETGDGDEGDGDKGDGDSQGGGQACGKATCGDGTVCCNASCGICTKPGGACIQVACEEQPATCAATTCPEGTECVEGPKGAECQKPQGGTSCAATLCPKDTYCDDISGQAECLPLPSCKDLTCDAGNHCELREVYCFRGPCPPQPACVPDPDPCALVDCAGECKVVKGKPLCVEPPECQNPCLTAKCSAGFHCQATQVECIKAPCCPVAQCVADGKGQACGDNTCSAGTYCCNASCGTCAPKGGACTQQFCAPND